MNGSCKKGAIRILKRGTEWERRNGLKRGSKGWEWKM